MMYFITTPVLLLGTKTKAKAHQLVQIACFCPMTAIMHVTNQVVHNFLSIYVAISFVSLCEMYEKHTHISLFLGVGKKGYTNMHKYCQKIIV